MRIRAWFRRSAPLGLLLAGAGWSGWAQAENPSNDARSHFERGYALSQSGLFEEAISEFERAYAISPNYSVLFNLGQAYGAAGRATDAERSLVRYLELGGATVDAEQRGRASELIDYYRRRIGDLELYGLPDGASVSLDGKELGVAPFDRALRATAGVHALSIRAVGFQSTTRTVNIDAGRATKLELSLVPEPTATLRIVCELPDVEVRLDGAHVGTSPLPNALPTASGSHQLALSRRGYATVVRALDFSAGQSRTVSCSLAPTATKEDRGRLLILHPRGSSVSVNGRPFDGQELPAGAHWVQVGGPGFETETRRVQLPAGERLSLEIRLRLSSQELENRRRTREKNQKLAAMIVGGTAVVAGGTALALSLANNGRYDEWQQRRTEFASRFREAPATTSLGELDQLLDEENSIRNRDSLALGVGVAAGVLALTSVALYLTAGSGTPSLVLSPRGEARLGYHYTF